MASSALDTTVIQAHIDPRLRDDIALEVFQSIDSTNDYLKQKSDAPSRRYEFCFADTQTRGRGRLGRTWHSPSGVNLYSSCRYRSQLNALQLSGLNIAVALSLLRLLQAEESIPGLNIKWPNDIRWHEQKLGGILIESTPSSLIVIGIGLNINLEGESQITQPWTSLKQILGRSCDRSRIFGRLVGELCRAIERFEKDGLSPFLLEWEQVDGLRGQEISVVRGDQVVTGKAIGVNAEGYLLLELSPGRVVPCIAGETSIIKPREGSL